MSSVSLFHYYLILTNLFLYLNAFTFDLTLVFCGCGNWSFQISNIQNQFALYMFVLELYEVQYSFSIGASSIKGGNSKIQWLQSFCKKDFIRKAPVCISGKRIKILILILVQTRLGIKPTT